jgi:hypothetical protein
MYFQNNDGWVFLVGIKKGGIWSPLESSMIRSISEVSKSFFLPTVSPSYLQKRRASQMTLLELFALLGRGVMEGVC